MVLQDPQWPTHQLTFTASEHPVPSAHYQPGDSAGWVVSYGHPTCVPGHIRTQRLDACGIDAVAYAWTGDDCQKH